MTPPPSIRAAPPAEIAPLIGWWVDRMRAPDRLIEERLVWFWHDQFATSLRKVRVRYLMRQQHVTIRHHAAGSFADLLHAVTKDPAMLVFLDGITEHRREINENFGRECLEVFTMGRDGGYTQPDVVAASRSFSGWVVNLVGGPAGARLTTLGIAPWTAGFVARRRDADVKTLLGKSGGFDLDRALDVILHQPATGRFVAKKLYRQLVGLAGGVHHRRRRLRHPPGSGAAPPRPARGGRPRHRGPLHRLGDAADRVLVMTTSEFGRRPGENGSGTDHGPRTPTSSSAPASRVVATARRRH